MHLFRCSACNTTVFFDNDHCGTCGATLGLIPGLLKIQSYVTPAVGDTNAPWTPLGITPAAPLRPCGNRLAHGICNWMLDDGDMGSLCRSCRLTQVVPPLNQGRNRQRWHVIERAKRRLIFGLLAMGLAPEPKNSPDDRLGLGFQLLENQPGLPPVQTGHRDGLITLNVAEADDDQRESLRVQLGEPTRTLLGHLRHETAHYLQYRWIDNTPAMTGWREVFGDERLDYQSALARHYAEGPPGDWPQRYVSAYASAHPWEDWAETCAHYLLVLDAVQTASSWGLTLHGPAEAAPDTLEVAQAPTVANLVLEQWLPVAQFLNAMNRSLGLPDSYPFLLPSTVLEKMTAVQQLLRPVAAPVPVPA